MLNVMYYTDIMYKQWDIKDAELNRKCINEVIRRIQEIEGDEVGMIAAQDIINIIKENLAPVFYNKGIEDARKVVQSKIQDIDIDLDILRKR